MSATSIRAVPARHRLPYMREVRVPAEGSLAFRVMGSAATNEARADGSFLLLRAPQTASVPLFVWTDGLNGLAKVAVGTLGVLGQCTEVTALFLGQ